MSEPATTAPHGAHGVAAVNALHGGRESL